MAVFLRKYFWLVDVLAVALCAVLGGRATAHLVEQGWLLQPEAPHAVGARRPLAAEKTHDKDVTVVMRRNVFCSTCPPLIDKPVAASDTTLQSTEITRSTLAREVVSIMWSPTDPAWSMAIIRDLSTKEKDAAAYNKGKTLDGTQAVVLRVDPSRVYLNNAGHIEYLDLDPSAVKDDAPVVASVAPPPSNSSGSLDDDIERGVRCSGSQQCEVDRSLVDKMLANTAALATSARFVPSMKDGRSDGFKLYAIRPSSIFGKLGLKNGDTVKAINGMDMTSPDQALAIYTKLRTASHLSVAVERHGETVTMDYTIR